MVGSLCMWPPNLRLQLTSRALIPERTNLLSTECAARNGSAIR
jgi:hypothetical protein